MIAKKWRHNWQQGASEKKERYLSEANQLSGVQKYKSRTFDILAVKKGDYILDVGCGTGDDARLLAKRVGRGGKVVGVDINQSLIDCARKQTESLNLPLEFHQADVYDLTSLDDNKFDGCRADRTLQHLKYPHIALAQMIRTLRPGGRIVVSEPDWGTLVVDSPDDRALTRQILNYWADTRNSGWVGRQLPALFQKGGLTKIEVQAISISGVVRKYNWELDFIALVKSAQGARDDGLISDVEADNWLNNLKETEQAGCFFAHLGGFVVKGQKP